MTLQVYLYMVYDFEFRTTMVDIHTQDKINKVAIENF